MAPPGVTALVAGVTGVGGGSEALVSMPAEAFCVAGRVWSPSSVISRSHIAQRLHRTGIFCLRLRLARLRPSRCRWRAASGRRSRICVDDAGGGYWIGREALRRLWRREDEQPGAWRESALARRLFAVVVGDSSIHSGPFL